MPLLKEAHNWRGPLAVYGPVNLRPSSGSKITMGDRTLGGGAFLH